MENMVISTTTSSITNGFTSFRAPRTVIPTIWRSVFSKYSVSLAGHCWFEDPCLGKQCRECDFLRLDFQVYTFWEIHSVSYHYKARVIVSHLTIYHSNNHVIFLSAMFSRIRHTRLVGKESPWTGDWFWERKVCEGVFGTWWHEHEMIILVRLGW